MALLIKDETAQFEKPYTPGISSFLLTLYRYYHMKNTLFFLLFFRLILFSRRDIVYIVQKNYG